MSSVPATQATAWLGITRAVKVNGTGMKAENFFRPVAHFIYSAVESSLIRNILPLMDPFGKM